MLATNYVYATLQGYYPRLLAKDGWHEPLVIPINPTDDFDLYIELYRDNGQKVDLQGLHQPTTGTITWEGTGSAVVAVSSVNTTTDVVQLSFSAIDFTQARRGVLRLRVRMVVNGNPVDYYVYPIEVVVG